MPAAAHYAVLGLGFDASDDEVKRAYRRLSRRYHPDTAGTNGEANTEEFIRITQAYHAIIDGAEPTIPVRPASPPASSPPSRKGRKHRRLELRFVLKAALGLALVVGILVAACLVISKMYSRRVMLRALHDGGVAFVPPAARYEVAEEPAALTFAEKLRRERQAEAMTAKKEDSGKKRNDSGENVASQPSPVASSRPSPAVISTAGRDLMQQTSAATTNPRRKNAGIPTASSQPTPVASSQPSTTLPSQPSPVASSQPSLPPSSQSSLPPSSRPSPTVISTAGRDLTQQTSTAATNPSHNTTKFPADTRNDREALPSRLTPVAAAQPTPTASSQLSIAPSSRPTPPVISTAPPVISTEGRDLTQQTSAATTNPSHNNTKFPTDAGNDKEVVSSRPTPAVISTAGRNPKPTITATIPSSPTAQPAKSPPAEAQLQQRLDSFLAAYCQAYGARNLNKFKPFFTPKATENGTPIIDLMPTYTKLFASTDTLTLQISPLNWHQPTPGHITLNGRFTIDLHYRDSGPVHGGGKIDFLLAWDDTSFQIEKMNYSFDK